MLFSKHEEYRNYMSLCIIEKEINWIILNIQTCNNNHYYPRLHKDECYQDWTVL
jgi:hypothetical protein